MSEPLKVSISPKAMRTEWCISPNGGQQNPATSNAHPKVHIATADMSCSFLISSSRLSPGSRHSCTAFCTCFGQRKRFGQH